MDLSRILKELRTERDRLDRAIAALQGVDSTRVGKPNGRRARKRRRISAEGRRRLSEMMKKRWAERKKKARVA